LISSRLNCSSFFCSITCVKVGDFSGFDTVHFTASFDVFFLRHQVGMNPPIVAACALFCLAVIFQVLYSSSASKIIRKFKVDLKLRKWSSYSYDRKYLKQLLTETRDDSLKRELSRMLVFKSMVVWFLFGVVAMFLVGLFAFP
jgi:hypothetical protein